MLISANPNLIAKGPDLVQRALLILLLFLTIPTHSQDLLIPYKGLRRKDYDIRRVRDVVKPELELNSTISTEVPDAVDAYENKLNYAVKLARCFTLDGNNLPELNPVSHLITHASCRNGSECERCFSMVRECEKKNWNSSDCESVADDQNRKAERSSYGIGDLDWLESISPKLVFHCYRPSLEAGNIDAYFRMEYSDKLILRNMTENNPMMIPRIFVVEKMERGRSEIIATDAWMLSLREVPIEGRYTMRVTPVSPAAVYKVQTLPWMDFAGSKERSKAKPLVVSVEYDNRTIGTNRTEMIIRWKSSLAGNASCNSNVFFLDADDLDYFPHELKEPEHAFWTVVRRKLQFEKTYKIQIMEKFADTESDLEVYLVDVPSCFQVYNFSFLHCRPPAPKILTVATDIDGSLKVEWEPPEYSSPSNSISHYNLSIRQSDGFPNGKTAAAPLSSLHALQMNIYSTRIDGNKTSHRIRNETFHDKITVLLYAYTKGGVSINAEADFEFPNPEEAAGFLEKIWIFLSVAALVITTIGTLLWLKSYRDKLQRKKQLHEYFEKLDKESIQPDPAVVDRYSSKWEIPLGALVIGDVIGEGAFGLVRKALLYQEGRKIVVAVKSLRDGVDDKESDKFWEEFNILRGLEPHQHVVGLVGIVKAHVPALVVEYCSGGDLQSHLRKFSQSRITASSSRFSNSRSTSTNDSSSGISTSEARVRMTMVTNEAYFMNKFEPEVNITEVDLLCYARQISSGMEFLSSNKIVHRDLAARNVLIGHNRTLKIADFGLSRDVYEQNWYKKSSNGKIPIKWMALECLLQEVYTTKSDVWSYGILLWEIVTFGGNPYPGIENTRIFDLLKSGYRMAKPENCSDELYDLMHQCWQENPKDRPEFTSIRKMLDGIIEKSNYCVYMNVDHLRSESELSDIESELD